MSGLDLQAAEQWALERGLPRYRGRQLHVAMTLRAIQDISELTEFPVALRERMSTDISLRSLQVKLHLKSERDRSEKVLFRLGDGTTVESVLIRSCGQGRARNTICVSSQVGCPAACTFCATGLGGFGRNLTAAEIVDQVHFFSHQLRAQGQHVTNVVFMGMGEPLLNVPNVRTAVHWLTDAHAFNLGDRHVTVSTVGIIPQIQHFAEWAGQVNLAVSLHAPNDELRSQIVPYNKRFPIGPLMESVQAYIVKSHRRVSFEYVLLRDVNDSAQVADELAQLLRPFAGMAHVNLIPWNPFREGKFVRSEGPDASAFAERLAVGRVNATIRYSKGLDISAACGQLREQVESQLPA